MRLPDFLVIGAMKCGTTTLYNDLKQSKCVFLAEKELNFLSSTAADQADASAQYSQFFRRARPDQCCGDVSTTYAMLPDLTGVVERACRLLSRGTKIIYIVREPVSRAISHHYHMSCHQGPGRMSRDIDLCVRKHASIVNYSRYAMQLAPWQKAFGDDAIKVVVFEEYISDRQRILQDIYRFLKLAHSLSGDDTSVIHNQSEGKRILNTFWHGVYRSRLYQHVLRPMIPARFKQELSKFLLPVAPGRPALPSPGTVEFILKSTREDVAEITCFLRRQEPLWNSELLSSELGNSAVRAA